MLPSFDFNFRLLHHYFIGISSLQTKTIQRKTLFFRTYNNRVMTAILIDDEQFARDTLKILLNNYCPTVEIIAEADSGFTGMEAILKHRPELVFLDVEVGDMTSFQMLDDLGFPNLDFNIIFSTAHDHYAVNAFRYSAIDFLEKPVDERTLQTAVMRAHERVSVKQKLELLTILKQNLLPQSPKRLVLQTPTGNFIAPIEDIILMQTSIGKRSTEVSLTRNRQQETTKTLSEYENLDPFIRVHNSTIINPNHIVQVNKNTPNWQLDMTNGHKVDVARGRKDVVVEWLDKLSNVG